MKIPITQSQSLSLRISIIDKCEFRCLYCMPPEGVPRLRHEDILSFEQIADFVSLAKSEFALRKVHLTGGEPLVRKNVVELVRMLSELGVEDLALTTNACKLASLAPALGAAGLDRVNVSLDSLDPETFAALTRGGDLAGVVAGVDAAMAEGLGPIKFNTVVLRGYNDQQLVDMARWALDRGCIIRFLELMPIGCIKPDFEKLYVPYAEILKRLRTGFDLEPEPFRPGASTRCFKVSSTEGPNGTLGLISGQSKPFCSSCRRLRLTSTGRLITCLAHGQGPDIAHLLCSKDPADREKLRKIISDELDAKAHRGDFDTDHAMASVGG